MNPYIGLWQRASIQIGETAPFEDTTVYWLQAETYFADIRIPFNQPPLSQPLLSLDRDSLLPFTQISAFAGTIDYTTTWIRWHRQIDFSPSSDIDQGEVHFVGPNLIERGESTIDGKVETYTEVWVPQPTDPSTRLVLELVKAKNLKTQAITYPKGLWVTVGDHAIRICDLRSNLPTTSDPTTLSETELKHLMQFQATYSQRHNNKWQIKLSSDPTQIGSSLDYPILQNDTLIETQQQTPDELIEYIWEIREITNWLTK
jgi:hypothetical protein